MKIAIAHLESLSPYGQSRFHNTPRIEGRSGTKTETHDDYEKRTWMHRAHINAEGHMFLPPMAFKNCLSEAAKYISQQIPGQGKATYTKHFEAGVMVLDPLVLSVTDKDLLGMGLWLHVPSDGMRGGKKRVMKCFPVIQNWSGAVTFHILDEKITQPVFEQHLKDAGSFIGIGFFRPRNNGYYGRFKVNKVDWSKGS